MLEGMQEKVLVERVYRTGRQWLSHRSPGRFYMNIENRTYQSRVEVPVTTAVRYWREMKKYGRQ